MGRNLSTLFISQSYQFLTQISGSELQDGLGNTITGSLAITSSQAISASFATTASFALNAGTTVSTASLLTTASAVNNVITFTKGDASTFNVTVATGSAVSTGSFATTGSNTFIGNQTITGSVNITGSIVMVNGADIVTHHVKAPAVNGVEIQNNAAGVVALFGAGGGLGTTFYGQINGTVFSGSAVTASLLGTASFAVSASQAQNAVSASFAPASNPFPFTGSAVITGSLVVTGSAIIGGTGNSATGISSVVFGGINNSVSSAYSAIVGGNANTSNGARSAIIGGENNSTSNTATGGIYSGNGNSIIGGNDNVLVTVGGVSNVINSNGGVGVTIVGGQSNVIRNFASTGLSRDSHCAIVGGKSNRIDDGANSSTGGSNGQSVILGGIDNNIKGVYTLSTDNYSVGILTSSGSVITATSRSAIIGGQNNLISGSNNSVILGGSNITASVSNTVYVPNLNVSGSSTFQQSLVFSGSVRGEVKALTISSQTASLDCSTDNFFTLLLVSGSTTFVNPSNILPGQTINLRVKQASVASGSISFASSVKQVSGSAYTPTTTANGEDIVTFISFDSTNLYLSNIKNFV